MSSRDHLLYIALRVWAGVHALLPYWLLYFISDIYYVVLYHLIGYRREVVRRNLTNSFPDKTIDEIVQIERAFYHHLCDWALEVFKLTGVSAKSIGQRMVFKNLSMIDQFIKEGRSGFVLMGHCGNWEYITSMPLPFLHLKELNVCFGHVYRPLHNKAMDRFFKNMRGRFGSEHISESELLRTVLRMKNDSTRYCIGVLADQIPYYYGQFRWTTFMHQDTPVYTGIQKIATKVGAYVGYFDIKKVRRGYYEAEFKLLTNDASGMDEKELSELYIRTLEQTINANPAYWLWTHNRWKRTREDYKSFPKY